MTTVKTRDIGSWLLIAAIVAVGAVVYLRPTASANTPALFDGSPATLDAAMAEASSNGRVVFAYATADWCGPCQSYKKNTLSDPRVEKWVATNAVPVYIDVDHAPADAQRLEVQGIPATLIIKDGMIVDRQVGAVPPGALLPWLEQAAAEAKN